MSTKRNDGPSMAGREGDEASPLAPVFDALEDGGHRLEPLVARGAEGEVGPLLLRETGNGGVAAGPSQHVAPGEARGRETGAAALARGRACSCARTLVIMRHRAWCHSPFFFAGVHWRCTGRKSKRNAAAAFVSASVASCGRERRGLPGAGIAPGRGARARGERRAESGG